MLVFPFGGDREDNELCVGDGMKNALMEDATMLCQSLRLSRFIHSIKTLKRIPQIAQSLGSQEFAYCFVADEYKTLIYPMRPKHSNL